MQRRFFLFVPITIVILAAVWFLIARPGGRSDVEAPEADVKTTSAPETTVADDAPYEKLVGRWRRTDGGYLIEVGGVDENGKLKVAYYNPKPINVSRAEYAGEGDSLALFIELNDVGYPGATYRLIYEAERDLLIGLYHQPSVGQTFDVFFMRLR